MALTIEISQLQYFRKVVDVPVVFVVPAPQSHVVVETAEIPQLQVVEHSSLYGGVGEVEAFRPFYGPFSHSVHLDVECRVAGTPGACSQVFCHPIRCKSARGRTDSLV